MSGKDIDSLFNSGQLAAITFMTADAAFAIPLEQVLYIEKDVKRNLQVNELDEFNHEVITYQNNTVQLFDFNQLIGSENHQTMMNKLVTKLDEMEQQHRDWLDALEVSLKNNTPFTKALDPNKCAFGIWYNKFETDIDELKEALQRFDAPHKKLHGLAETLLHLNSTDHDEAMKILSIERQTTLSELIHLFHLTKERALSSIRPIILFVEHNSGKVTALRLDNINDIVTFDKKVFCLDDSASGIMRSKNEDFVVEGFLRDGNEAPLMLINCQPSKKDESEQVA
jgi:Chemoreceptor zinc-binding domain